MIIIINREDQDRAIGRQLRELDAPPLTGGAPWGMLQFSVLRQCQGILNVDTQISDRRFNLGVTEKDLDRA